MKQIFNFVFGNGEHSRPFSPIKQILWKSFISFFFVAGILFNGNQEKLQGFLRRKKTDPFWELQNLIKVLSWFKKERTSESDAWFARRGKNTDWQTEAAGGAATCEGGKRKINTQILRFPLPASLFVWCLACLVFHLGAVVIIHIPSTTSWFKSSL